MGFQKTGATSLQYALSLLGYRVAGVFSVKDMDNFEEVRAQALYFMQGFDAAADNPWSVLYGDLDFEFSGSKFILTTRDADKWYASACEHFGERGSRLREWIHGPANPLGQEGVYKQRLLQYSVDVRSYFADRPSDFLEFDVARGDGWQVLCRFLGKPTPWCDFPRLNTAAIRTR